MGMFSNASYLTADATANWWGHSSGPYHATLNPEGLGDDVSDYILFEPFTQPVISISPAYDITTCSVAKTFSFFYDGTGVPEQLRGYEVTFTIDPAVATVAAIGSDIVEGAFLDAIAPAQFYAVDAGSGTYKINCAILGGSVGATGSGELFSVKLTPVAEGTSAITITGIKLRDVNNVPMAGSFTGASLQVDCTVPTMEALAEAQGQYYNATPVFSNFGFDDDVNLDTAEYRIDSGAWTALFAGIDAAEWNSDGWALPGFDGLAQGSHTVYFRVSDDAGNVNGEGTPDTYSWQFYKDTILPVPPTNFTALPGHNKVHLTWTNPPSDPSFAGVEIRRVGWSDYPEYGTGTPVIAAPAYPADETGGAFVTQTLLGAYDDASMTYRDIYYYAAFAYDVAGNYSVFDIGAADRSTSYWLGDVDSTGYVNMSDLVYFSGTFGESDADPGWNPFCDFGPTDDWSSFGIPLPDDIVDFEDLMIFSMIYNNVGPLGSPAPMIEERQIEELAGLVGFDIASVASDDGIVISVTLSNNAKTLKGFRLVLDAGETGRIVGVEPGSIFNGRSDLFFGSVPASGGRADISVAALGIDRELQGSGEVAKIHVRLEEGARADVRFETIDVRDVANTRFELLNGDDHELPVVPVVTALMQNYPNPFNPVTTISFDMAKAGRVAINVYGVSGHLIRTLVDNYMEPGRYNIDWDGRDNNGSRVSSGVYFYRMRTADYNSTRKMILLR
ncbi:MAG: T9SS type A sorting domain-containing protein [Candidatus Krumholzibacteria bacterium]|jgi:hypothetical protein|nr:T9SS type A sorting domain-containing protein [Candidatus Krumholzibacteria bacterium]